MDVQDLHRGCTFANYQVESDGQRRALSMAKSYAQQFGFVFSGAPGTGKNHLAAAIGNHLLAGGRSVLVVTIPDLMLRVRECYDGGQSEASLLDDLCHVDLLILDEVGIQRGSSGEKVILNQVIDRRLSSMRPVGILTNLNYESLKETLGMRILDRLQMDGGIWVNFEWYSYRKACNICTRLSEEVMVRVLTTFERPEYVRAVIRITRNQGRLTTTESIKTRYCPAVFFHSRSEWRGGPAWSFGIVL